MIGLFCFDLAVLASPFKSKMRLEAENAVLRHQLIVLRRKLRGRVQLANSDRWFFVQLYHWFPLILQVLTIIRPETLIRWHRSGFRCYWRWKSQSYVVRLDRRDLVWINVTRNPTAEWVARQITEAFPWDGAPGYMLRDRDRIYSTIVTRRLRAMGIRDKPIAPASPWQNGFAERLIGSIRRECLDHIVVFGEAHLRRILRSYARYYNDIRTHRSLHKDAPIFRPIHQTGIIRSHPILGELHHHYVRL